MPFRRDRHHAERLLRLALGDNVELAPEHVRPRVYPNAADHAAAAAILPAPPNDSRPLLALAPGSVWATKRWPYFAELARAIQRRARCVVVGSGADRELAEGIRAATAGDAVDATGRLSLLASAALIGRSAAIVSNDSAPLHLASAMNVATVAVFGPTVPEFGFGPLAERSLVAQHQGLACRPCHPHGPRVCPLGHWRCMRDLSVQHVLDAVHTLL